MKSIKNYKSIALGALTVLSFNVFGIDFSQREIQFYLRNSNLIHARATECLNSTWNTHVSFFKTWNVSKFYGDQNQSLATREQRIKALESFGAPAFLVDELEATSCIGLTLKCLGKGFNSTSQPEVIEIWERLNQYVRANGSTGIHLLEGLKKLGWRIVYWNPSPEDNLEWDQEDQKLLPGQPVEWNSGVVNENGQYIYHPGWGLHQTRFEIVNNQNKYYTLDVDDKTSLVNFGTNVPSLISEAQLFVGVAHAGYHVFPGVGGDVIEAHSARPLNWFNNLERTLFNPLHKEGGPVWTKSEKYRSGVIALPPGN